MGQVIAQNIVSSIFVKFMLIEYKKLSEGKGNYLIRRWGIPVLIQKKKILFPPNYMANAKWCMK